MVIDSSALLAILCNEPDASILAEAIQSADVRLMSAASILETAIVIESRYGMRGGDKLDEMIAVAQIRVEPVTLDQIVVARLAYRRFGKGRHAASLNFGDCFAYALAEIRGVPLLFKGDDFSLTDIESAL